MEKYICVEDLQGTNFGVGRIKTIEKWRKQAMDWTDSEESDLYKTLKKLPEEEVIPFIEDMWEIRIKNVNELNDEEKKYFSSKLISAKLVKKVKEQGMYEDIFEIVDDYLNDYETLEVGIEIIKIARNRLIYDLDDIKIKNEYDKLGNILIELKLILENYV